MRVININWPKTKNRVKKGILYLAIAVFFISLISLFTESHPETTLFFMVVSTVVLGYLFGAYVSRIFLRQSKRAQTRTLIFLPAFSLFCLILSTALFSGLRHVTVFKVVVLSLLVIFFSFSLGVFVSLIYRKLRQQITVAESAAAHSKSELQLLQAQLSPHFLFNTLNNLYGISLTEPEKTPGMLLKLSELLRYSVYDAKDSLVPLKDEVNYLNNYIEFEKIRIGNRLDLKVDIENFNMNNIWIAPMLLVIFVENAFKHGKNNLSDKIQIEISLKQWLNQLLFSVKNSHKDTGIPDAMNKHSGFGLQSTIKRLELLYPQAHDLSIQKDEDSFSVMLRVNIKRV